MGGGPVAAGSSGLIEGPCSSVPPNRFYASPELPDCPTFKENVLIPDCIFSMKISAFRERLNLKKIKQNT